MGHRLGGNAAPGKDNISQISMDGAGSGEFFQSEKIYVAKDFGNL
jgi:hypothetical protein